ncbi:MAG: hypothetical protein ACK5HP_00210 [Bacilli bacterium]
MNDLNLDKYLDIANKVKLEKGLDTYLSLYPMLRKIEDMLYVCVVLTNENDNVWSITSNIIPEYWMLIDINTFEVVEFNKTGEKKFAIEIIKEKNIENKQKEISKYTVEKTLQYKEYLMQDVINQQLPIQKNLSLIIGDKIEINGETITVNNYLISMLENDINQKVNELVDLLAHSKYGSITFYYDCIIQEVINEYIDNKIINLNKMELCVEIMDNYYDGVIGIKNIFNI